MAKTRKSSRRSVIVQTGRSAKGRSETVQGEPGETVSSGAGKPAKGGAGTSAKGGAGASAKAAGGSATAASIKIQTTDP